MERTETEHLIFEIRDVSPDFKWPADPRFPCVGKNCGRDKVEIVRGPDCTQADLDDVKERFENDWKELHGIELAADALRFHRR